MMTTDNHKGEVSNLEKKTRLDRGRTHHKSMKGQERDWLI